MKVIIEKGMIPDTSSVVLGGVIKSMLELHEADGIGTITMMFDVSSKGEKIDSKKEIWDVKLAPDHKQGD